MPDVLGMLQRGAVPQYRAVGVRHSSLANGLGQGKQDEGRGYGPAMMGRDYAAGGSSRQEPRPYNAVQSAGALLVFNSLPQRTNDTPVSTLDGPLAVEGTCTVASVGARQRATQMRSETEVDVPCSVAYECYSDHEVIPQWMPFISVVKKNQCIYERDSQIQWSFEHFKQLLASTYPEILVATLETLSALVKINPSKLHVSGKLIECGSINNYLLSLAQGCGSKEEGLGLYSCVVTNERNQNDGLCVFLTDLGNENDGTHYRFGSTLNYEFSGSTS